MNEELKPFSLSITSDTGAEVTVDLGGSITSLIQGIVSAMKDYEGIRLVILSAADTYEDQMGEKPQGE